MRQFGVAGCASRMAQEFGDHPEAAAGRMRWIRQLIGVPSVAASSRLAEPGSQPTAPVLAPGANQPATGRACHAA